MSFCRLRSQTRLSRQRAERGERSACRDLGQCLYGLSHPVSIQKVVEEIYAKLKESGFDSKQALLAAKIFRESS